MWSFVTGFFHMTQCFQDSSMLQHMSVLHFVLLPNNIPFYGSITFYLSVHRLIDFKWFPLFSYYEYHCYEQSHTGFYVDICFHFPWVQISVQFSSVAQSCPILCSPMDSSTPCFPVHHQPPELAQTHVHQVGDAIQLSHPLLSPSPPAFNLSQHQGLFQ